ncbi:MAG: hypothetical protein CBE23_003100 [Candidatus Pelagibacter sp. TMED263]|nr:MAG: hypothetical protein CBE23_003100 [Candidatus Pelagibacter sp. TMED263]|tara:strand:+ start:168 stop:467 length:300 start_codon:yes stop_codon:yes gene_type:complete
MKIFFIFVFLIINLTSCQTVTKKIDEKVSEEEVQLSKWLNKSELELKIEFGKPDQIKFKNNSRNRFYIYTKEKLKIKCERIFEINPANKVTGFTSKNCF